MNQGLPRILPLVGIVALAVAYANMPYGYYTLLRIVITALALTQCYYLFQRYDRFSRSMATNLSLVAFILTIAIYNPIIPVYLSRDVWQIINAATIALFAYAFHFNKRDQVWRLRRQGACVQALPGSRPKQQRQRTLKNRRHEGRRLTGKCDDFRKRTARAVTEHCPDRRCTCQI